MKDLQLEKVVRDTIVKYKMIVPGICLLPVFPEEQIP